MYFDPFITLDFVSLISELISIFMSEVFPLPQSDSFVWFYLFFVAISSADVSSGRPWCRPLIG